MTRIKAKFAELKAKNQKALIPYVMVGFPNEKATLLAVRGLIRGGADIIELGFPFSDPLADGPVIQNASTVSLKKGMMTIKKFFGIVKKIRKETEIPLILMTYTNILYHYGYAKFVTDAKKAGIDGFILPDMSVDESKEYLEVATKNKVDTIFLISPNTENARIQKISKVTSGFLYLVAVFGTTGIKNEIKKYTLDAIKQVKRQQQSKARKRDIPIAIGFGVSTPKDVKTYIDAGVDAVIVGSAYLKLIEETPQNQIESKIFSFTKSLKKQTRL